MYRKTISLVLMLALVGVVGTAVAMAQGRTGDTSGATTRNDPQEAVRIYATIQGETQGEISGDVTRKGLEGAIQVLGFDHEIVSPRDAASGLPTGKRQHKPLSIMKRVDKTTPQLMSALTSNENLTQVQLDFFRPDKTGKMERYFTIQLKNASIAGIQMERAAGMQIEPREHISFTYQKITWTWYDGGITHEDDWETPVSAILTGDVEALAS